MILTGSFCHHDTIRLGCASI